MNQSNKKYRMLNKTHCKTITSVVNVCDRDIFLKKEVQRQNIRKDRTNYARFFCSKYAGWAIGFEILKIII